MPNPYIDPHDGSRERKLEELIIAELTRRVEVAKDEQDKLIFKAEQRVIAQIIQLVDTKYELHLSVGGRAGEAIDTVCIVDTKSGLEINAALAAKGVERE